ncbi:MAG: hypothetical protein AAGC73_07770 [Verrucomicrobiota bacterium]
MHPRLVSYLKDNRDQIIENWLTETQVPSVKSELETVELTGLVPLEFYNHAFDTILATIWSGEAPTFVFNSMHLDHYLGITCSCRSRCYGGRVCIELHEAGLKAFMSVFREDWDTEAEFSPTDRTCFADIINHGLSGFFKAEIEHCDFKEIRKDCPFVGYGAQSDDRSEH